MANRANEKKGENTFCFYLNDGSVRKKERKKEIILYF